MKKRLLYGILIILVSLTAKAESKVNSPDNNQFKEKVSYISKKDIGKKSGFVWGADIGSSIDVSGNDMSSIDADAYFGYKNPVIRTLGVGASIHSSLGSNHTFIPVYLLFRTSFRSRPSLCFLDFRGGYSFNSITSTVTQGGIYGSLGCGFNLYMSSKFSSHLIIAYNYLELKPYKEGEIEHDNKSLSTVSIRIGISF